MKRLTQGLLLIGALAAGSITYASNWDDCDEHRGNGKGKSHASEEEYKAYGERDHRNQGQRCELSQGGTPKPPAEAKAALEADGSTVRRLAERNGCYVVQGTDARGFRFGGFIHPETLKPIQPDA